MTFKDFLYELDKSVPKEFRILSTMFDKEEHPISKRFGVSDRKPSQSLNTFLTRDFEYIHRGYKTTTIDPKAFYKGHFIDIAPIVHDLDVRRSISDNIMSEVFLATEEEKTEKTEFYLIKGHAGSGKSVILRRLAWDASIEFDKLCLLLTQSAYPEYEPLSELFTLCKERIFLFIDNVSKYSELIENFLLRAREDRLPITIIGAERGNEWNINCENLEPYLSYTYEVQYLSEKEIEDLIRLLTKHKSLGHLEGMTFNEQKDALSKRAGRQLLVALHEATLGKPFTDIVFDEYESIPSEQAQSIYLTVCILHRLGVATRAGLISRIYGVPFTFFKQNLFKPLEFVVFALEDKVIKDYVYRSRHSHIAEIVFERVLVDIQERFDEYVRIISALDIDYTSDRDAFKKLTSAKQLLELFDDPQMIRQIYSIANNRVGMEPMLMQQEAIFEMSSIDGSLDKATSILQQAYKITPYNKAIAHSLAELALRKADSANTPLERNKFRQESRKIAHDLISRGSISSHPYHTLVKIGIDELSELLENEDEASIEKKIKEIEKDISQALQFFPGDSFILDAEATFSNLINRYPKALESLKKAFAVNKRSPYIATRLAKMYEDRNEDELAIKVLKECIDANPTDKNTNFKLAMLLSKSSSANKNDVKYYLRRAFTEGDSNYMAQFWYARFLYLEGDYSGAQQLFKNLGEANVDTRIKREPGQVPFLVGVVGG